MKFLTLFSLGSLLLFSAAVSPAQKKKYDIKSGIITFENSIKMMGMTITKKHIVYFDDYGMKECRDEYEEKDLSESFFSDGINLYRANHAKKAVYKSGTAYRGTEFRFDWNEISDKDKKAGKAKQLGKMTIAGKECESFEYSDAGTTTKYAGWSHICLFTELNQKDLSSTIKAVKIEENAKIPAEKFKLPAGYTVQ